MEVSMPDLANFWPLAFCVIGTLSGLLVGVVPGIGPGTLIALAVPLTLSMNSLDAIVMLVGMYVGGICGGMVSAALLRIPAHPASIMTTLDAFPMARSGHPERALAICAVSSLIGGLIAGAILLVLSKPLSVWGTYFGPWEYFSLIAMGLVLMASVLQGNILGGLISGVLGLLASVPGVSAADGELRLTFGIDPLVGGFATLPVLLGLFVLGTALSSLLRKEDDAERVSLTGNAVGPLLPIFRIHLTNLVRSSLIGTWMGILPGVGAAISSIVSYTTAKTLSAEPEKFGTGYPGGIIASEAANHANVGGALIPLIALGIPGSAIDAILLGALILHNVQPGPLLFTNEPQLAWGVIVAYLLATLISAAVLLSGIRVIASLVRVPTNLLYPFMIIFAVLGCYSIRNSSFDVVVLFGFGVVGLAFDYLKIPLAPFVIGFVLGGLAETQLRAALMWSDGSFLGIFDRPVAIAFLVVALGTLVVPSLLRASRRRFRAASPAR
jgi:putative tricarboxylic transport membrane protein